MRVSFESKAEHKQKKQEEFLALSPAERFYLFLKLSRRIAEFPTSKDVSRKSSNFVITARDVWESGTMISTYSFGYAMSMM